MIFTYRITLEGIKGFYRVYKVDGNSSLYTFHKQIRADLEFTVDQPILFKAFSPEDKVLAKYALVDLGFGTVDTIKISDTVKAGVNRFVYFYDTAARKYVIITLEGEPEKGTLVTPVIIDTKGPLPIDFENGYVAFEDLPEEHRHLPGEKKNGTDDDEDDDDDDLDDDEEDDEDEDDDKEEEEIIYDANE